MDNKELIDQLRTVSGKSEEAAKALEKSTSEYVSLANAYADEVIHNQKMHKAITRIVQKLNTAIGLAVEGRATMHLTRAKQERDNLLEALKK